MVRMAYSARMAPCPVCGTEVASKNLARHRRDVHPSAVDRLARAKKPVFLATALVGVVTVGYLALTSAPGDNLDMQARWVGREAPDFTLPAVDGGSFKLSDYRGESPLLLFFNEGLMCAPCLRQMVDADRDDARFAALGVVQAAITTDPLPQLQQWAGSNEIRQLKVASDQSLEVDRVYEMLGKDVSMMAGTRAGHTYLLVDKEGIVRWRADYGPGVMYVEQDEIYQKVKQALEG